MGGWVGGGTAGPDRRNCQPGGSGDGCQALLQLLCIGCSHPVPTTCWKIIASSEMLRSNKSRVIVIAENVLQLLNNQI